ncbi:hypothetical protein ACTFIU_011158 [Dictyostelium citrinum]
MNKVFSFPSNFQVNVAPFGTPEGITASSTLKNNDADLFLILSRVCNHLSSELASIVFVETTSQKKSMALSVVVCSTSNKFGKNWVFQAFVKVVSGLKVGVLPNFKSVHNPIPRSIPEGPKSESITKEVQDLLVYDAIEQVLPNQYSKLFFYSNVFTVPKPGTNLLRQVLDLKRLNTFIAYLHLLVDPHYSDLFRFVWKGVHYRWKTMPFGLSTAPRIFTMLLRPVLRMLRELNVFVIAYLDDLLIVGSTKEECLSNLDKRMELLVKLGFKLNLEKSVLEPTQSITFLWLQIDSVSMQLLVPKEKKKSVIKEIRNFLKLDSCTPRKLAGLKGKLIALEDAVIPFRFVQSHPTSVRSNSDGSVCIVSQPSNVQLLYNQNECTPTRMESMEAVSSVSTSNTFAFCAREDQLIEFHEGFYNTDFSGVEVSNLVFDDSKSSSSSSLSSVSSSSGHIPRKSSQRMTRFQEGSTSVQERRDTQQTANHVCNDIGSARLRRLN